MPSLRDHINAINGFSGAFKEDEPPHQMDNKKNLVPMKFERLDIDVWLHYSSEPIEHRNCTAYEKGSFYCVFEMANDVHEERVFKYPISNIWRITESYPQELLK